MKCTRIDTDTKSTLTLEGALDAQTGSEVRPLFDEVIARRPRLVVIDVERVTMLDSHGVGMLVSLSKRLRADGAEMVVVGARDQPLMVIKLLKLEGLFGITQAEATRDNPL
jgi:anti-sigma B factor antagonist